MATLIRSRKNEWVNSPMAAGGGFLELDPSLAYSRDFNVSPRKVEPVAGSDETRLKAELDAWEAASDELWDSMDDASEL